jgi:hypothetical protein
MADKQQLMQALQELRGLAVQVRQGTVKKRDLKKVESELARRLQAVQAIEAQMAASGMMVPANLESQRVVPSSMEGLMAAAWKVAFSRAVVDIAKGYSVESIDAAIGVVAKMNNNDV